MREVEITLHLRGELPEHAMDRRARGLPHEPSDHFFGTSTGRRRDPNTFRDRILIRAVELASANRAEAGTSLIPRGPAKKVLISRNFLMGTAGFEPATSRV
ncbi:MAG: hypothetical protein QOF83_3369 [Solirubrobacteraceae bacterium]|nr:hypothetical protein [Solirubrobacteraceae bacterium]